MARKTPPRLTGEYPRRATKHLRDVDVMLRSELNRIVVQRGVRPAALARVAGMRPAVIHDVLAGNVSRVTVRTHGDLIEACCKIDFGEVKLEPKDFRHDWKPYPVTESSHERDACFRGHEYTDDTTYVHKGKRRCKVCIREAKRRWRERQRAKGLPQ